MTVPECCEGRAAGKEFEPCFECFAGEEEDEDDEKEEEEEEEDLLELLRSGCDSLDPDPDPEPESVTPVKVL